MSSPKLYSQSIWVFTTVNGQSNTRIQIKRLLFKLSNIRHKPKKGNSIDHVQMQGKILDITEKPRRISIDKNFCCAWRHHHPLSSK
jgi:hypothetical protein